MSNEGTEALAGLQLLVAVAKADSELTPEEGALIADALEDAKLPAGITARALIDSSSDVDSLIGQVESQGARDVALAACVTLAAADDGCLPKQQVILDRIEAAWAVPTEAESLAGGIPVRVSDAMCPATPEPDADRIERDASVHEDVPRGMFSRLRADEEHRAHIARIERLATECKAGRITLTDHERDVEEPN